MLSGDLNRQKDGLGSSKSVGFWSTFSLVGLAELGDKTQIAAIGLAAEFDTPVLIFLGFAIALLILSLSTAILGEKVSKFIPMRIVKMISGFIFLGLGIFFLLGLRV